MSSEEQSKILSQVEFYFSDSNLLNDKFLFTTQQANEGWVPVSVISQFERMKKYRPVETIVEALRQSPELLEVSENGELVRRKTALPSNQNEIQVAINKRSVFVEHLPTEASLDELIQFFSKFSPTNQVRMKKKNNAFVGSVIVEFKKEEDAQKFLELDPKPKYGEKELTAISKISYDESMAQKFGERRGGRGRKQNGKGNYRKGGKDDRKRDQSPKREESSKEEKEDRDDAPKEEMKEEKNEEKKEEKKEDN
ncbi:hypothetical protein CANARDRAFT_199069 [[Candida] arabinofermentans NRRL YB-2248]|uniref:HTH La-type RNA-binding domain-containing protein n=1 Tax=[Candida] arabinofermentans NRRL YB-2248 TaxID=983967 RepID=A0A1E4T0J3_9ASCO|nr:hypothetical protein CANARDRAFT_199069 [[Candida] arabinofermentans NRRL YB-2248]